MHLSLSEPQGVYTAAACAALDLYLVSVSSPEEKTGKPETGSDRGV